MEPTGIEIARAQTRHRAGWWQRAGMERLDALQRLQGWPLRGVLLLLGGLSATAMAPVFAFPVLFFTLPLLSLLLSAPKSRRETHSFIARLRIAGARGWWFGFGFFLVGLHWIVQPFLVDVATFGWLAPVALVAMPGGLALFTAFACALACGLLTVGQNRAEPSTDGPARAASSDGLTAACALAAGFGVAELARGTALTGFPWNPIGHALTGHAWSLQWAGLFGSYALNIVAVFIFVLPGLILADLVAERTPTKTALYRLVTLAAFVVNGLAIGALLGREQTARFENVRLRLVQPSIDQREKWKPENRRMILERTLALTQGRGDDDARAEPIRPVTHVIWPEVAMPFLMLRTREAMQAIADVLPDDSFLLTGTLRMRAAGDAADGERTFYNSLTTIDGQGALLTSYDKQHLVPFGEYLPFRGVLSAIGLRRLVELRGSFDPGEGARLLTVPGLPAVAPLICYEAIFPGDVVSGPQRPSWMLIITNDAWFGTWAGPLQHAHHARLRAVEEGLAVVRVSNNGISGVYDPAGRLRAHLPLGARGFLDVDLPKPFTAPLASRYATEILLGLLAVLLARVLFDRLLARRERRPAQP
ncbi:MAG: apolipoprotein N-acyltransferase [Pseudomonadota bacterium]